MAPKRAKTSGTASTTTKRAPKKSGGGIGKLSPDILASIFAHLHPMTMEIAKNTPQRRASPGSCYRDSRRHEESSYGDGVIVGGRDPLPATEAPEVAKFTYHLHEIRRVSKQWRKVIEATPHYQSRVVVWLDKSPSMPALKAQLNKAGEVPLDVLVSRGDFEDSSKLNEKKEQALSHTVMSALAPYVSQCRVFVFKVKYSTSLPLISKNFRGEAMDLRRLELSCEEDVESTDVNVEAAELTEDDDPFTFPQLTTLVMEGNTFMDACLVSTFVDQLKESRLDSLTIYGLSPPDPDEVEDDRYEGFDLYQFVRILSEVPYIRYLKLEQLGIAYLEGEAAQNATPMNVDSISLIDQDSVFIMEFLSASYGSPPYCLYHLSGTELDFDSVPRAHHLRLENIPNVGTDVFNYALPRHWGDRLDFVDCEKLDDIQLEWIADNCEHVTRLYIIDCPNITVKGLRAMVKRRAQLMAEKGRYESDDKDESDEDEDRGRPGDESVEEVDTDDDDRVDGLWSDTANGQKNHQGSYSYKPFRRLQVEKHSAKLSSADRQWLRKNVGKFFWK